MALKDWKKVKTNRTNWISWKEKLTHRQIIVVQYSSDSNWTFLNNIVFATIEKYFKTKSQALEFAKHYMRTH